MPQRKRVTLATFLRELHNDPKLLRKFKDDPKAAAREVGLSPKHQNLLASRDARAIGHALVDEHIDAHTKGEAAEPMTFALNWIVFTTSTATNEK